MNQNGCRIGGEQSGHIIFSKYASTGDGILTSLKMMEVMMARKAKMSQLTEGLTIYPQVLENVRVVDKTAAQEDPDVKAAVKAVEEAPDVSWSVNPEQNRYFVSWWKPRPKNAAGNMSTR